MLIFVVACSRLDRYEELRRQFEDGRDVRIILDRREGERRLPHSTFAGVNRRRAERRRVDTGIEALCLLCSDEGHVRKGSYARFQHITTPARYGRCLKKTWAGEAIDLGGGAQAETANQSRMTNLRIV
jgi:hypothetical protein